MLRSMTGFGKGVSRSRLGTVTTEIKTINHRYLDIFLKIPKEMQALEPRVKDSINEAICRGRVEVTIERRGGESSISAEINRSQAKKYLMSLNRLGKELGLKDTPSIALLCQMPGVIESCTIALPAEKVWVDVKKSLDGALRHLSIMREREGKFIEQDIRKRLGKIAKKVREIERRLPILLDKYREEVKRRGAELGGKAEEKLSTEIALLSEKVDISEELVRFSSHLNQLNLFLDEGVDVGKKINFTVQEMMREINTMSAKANDFSVSRASVMIKTDLEKIKEQIQNIE